MPAGDSFDDIEDSDDEGSARPPCASTAALGFPSTPAAAGTMPSGAATRPAALPGTPAAAQAAPASSVRSGLVSGLNLSGSQMGQVTAAGSSRSSRGRLGAYGTHVQRAATEASTAAQVMLVRHRILGPAPPTVEALRAALSDPELRHLVLRLREVHSTSPLVVATCETECDEAVRVVMQRAVFERACRSAGADKPKFALFGSYMERTCPDGGRIILAQHAESLPAGFAAAGPPDSSWAHVLGHDALAADGDNPVRQITYADEQFADDHDFGEYG